MAGSANIRNIDSAMLEFYSLFVRLMKPLAADP